MLKLGKRQARLTPEQVEVAKERRRSLDRKRKALKKSNETPEETMKRNRQHAANVSAARAKMRHQKEILKRNQQDAANKTAARANETPEDTLERNRQNAANMATVRAIETTEETLERNRQNAVNMATVRANETPEETLERNQQNTARMAGSRKKKKSHVDFKDAMRTNEILNGTFIVKPLQETEDKIGRMIIECPHCKAIKFLGETPSSCCLDGKVVLPHYPEPPNSLMQLWSGNDERSKVLRKYSRTLNNAVGLASTKNHAPRREGWCPTVILQGKVVTRAGPLLPENGERPQYSQLYIQDPSLELTIRYNNMTIPQNTSEQDKLILREVLEIIQTVLHEVNPFVQDFKQIIEIPDEEIANGKIVICAKAPSGQHVRRYNLQTNLKEVSILTDGQPHDLILQK